MPLKFVAGLPVSGWLGVALDGLVHRLGRVALAQVFRLAFAIVKIKTPLRIVRFAIAGNDRLSARASRFRRPFRMTVPKRGRAKKVL